VNGLKDNTEAFRYRLEGRRYLVEKEGSPSQLVGLGAEYRRTALELGKDPEGRDRDECFERALEIYREAIRVDTSRSTWRFALTGAAAVFADIGNFEKAFEFCGIVLEHHPDDKGAQAVMERLDSPRRAR